MPYPASRERTDASNGLAVPAPVAAIGVPPAPAYSRYSASSRAPALVSRPGSTSWLENELTTVSRCLARVAATFSRRSPPSRSSGPHWYRIRPSGCLP